MEIIIVGAAIIISGIIGRAIGYRQGVARESVRSFRRRWLGVA